MASNLHSNAFNFLSFMSHQVDPRTGQYTASVNFPDINANNLCGPALPLNLNFNPLNTLDSGFGAGWSWQLSQYDPTTEMLTLSTGEALRVSNWVDAKAEFNEQKLVTFNFTLKVLTPIVSSTNQGFQNDSVFMVLCIYLKSYILHRATN